MMWTLRYANRDVQASPISTAIGGEGQCCLVCGMVGFLVKIFFAPPPADLEARLIYMMANLPSSIVHMLAWPCDIVESGNGEVSGYLQRQFAPRFLPLTTLMSHLTRPRWATASLVNHCLQQVAYLLAELHAYGYLFPDLYGEQILVARDGSVVLIDTASCQFSDAGTLFPCNLIGGQDTQAPELLCGKNWAEVAPERSQHTDNWSLAVLIFETLMGCHPFDGVYIGPDKALPRKDRIKQGFFTFEYRATHDYRPPKNAPPYRRLDPDVREFFHRCFVEGYAKENAHRRPSAGEWSDVLRRSSHTPTAPPAPRTYPTAAKPSIPMATALRNAWDRTIQATCTISPRSFAIVGAAVLLFVVAALSYRFIPFGTTPPTVNRLRSTSDYPVQFEPSAPPVESVLHRLRGEANSKKEPTR